MLYYVCTCNKFNVHNMHYAEIKIVIQKPSNEAVEQDEDTEDDSSIVSDSESDEPETDLEDESSDYYYSDCSNFCDSLYY